MIGALRAVVCQGLSKAFHKRKVFLNKDLGSVRCFRVFLALRKKLKEIDQRSRNSWVHGGPRAIGYYNFTYVLENGVSENGYGKSSWEAWGREEGE